MNRAEMKEKLQWLRKYAVCSVFDVPAEEVTKAVRVVDELLKELEETPTTVKDVCSIIRNFLVENGYDGLAGEECGCGVDDLFLCDYISKTCQPAKLVKCDDCGRLGTERCIYPERDFSGGCYFSEEDKLSHKPS